MNRGYQNDFSSMHGDNVYDIKGRERKGITTLSVLKDYFGNDNLKNMSLLDVGASTGIIDNYLSSSFAEVTGIDIDTKAIKHAIETFPSENLIFKVGDAMSLDFPDCSFDVVLCSHVYEHVPDAIQMMDQIYRVLKPEGVCYFSAGNRMAIKEPHYNLSFLSIMPRPMAHLYLRILGRGKYYYEKHLSFWGLRKLVRSFEIIDYTKKVINEPQVFDAEYMLEPGSRKQMIAKLFVKHFYWLCPGYLWILKKPD